MTDTNAAPTVTDDWQDPIFDLPYTEVDELRDDPVPHRYVHGGFQGTKARFSFYFPPKQQYQGRFFHNTYPLAAISDIAPFPIAFAVSTGDLPFTLDSGAYYVQTNNGGAFSRQSADPSVAAYRVNAAAAKYSRIVAARLYGQHRPYGYLYGGSGGAYQTIGGAEHTQGVWDGFMPYVLGCNSATPSNWTPRMHALRVLRRRDKFPAIMDAINPGGSGDIYAGLNLEERSALEEATRMGFPPRGWYAYETQGSGYFADIQGVVPSLDPSYVDDFWSKPGYLGTNPSSTIRQDRWQHETVIHRAIGGLRFEVGSVPNQTIDDAHLVLLSGAATGRSFAIAAANGREITLANVSDAAAVAAIRPGDSVRLDNAWALALQTYHRHQVPSDLTEYGWNQFRDAAGSPAYPQRDRQMGQYFAVAAIGSLLSGRIHGKTLLVQSLMDIDSFAWFADWYRSLVRQNSPATFNDDFALWFIDHTQHDNPHTAVASAHTVSLTGALQRGLRDLAQWVEQGRKPSETAYRVVDAQVLVADSVTERQGVQPVIELKANGTARAQIKVGESVTFTGHVNVPDGAGQVIAAEWDFEGGGKFADAAGIGDTAQSVHLTAKHTYTKAGTFFAGLRAASQREGDLRSHHCRVLNLARVRVVVE
jgi:PKD domain